MMQAIPADMAVIEMSADGGPDVLVPGRRPVPHLSAGEVLIRVEAAGVNGPDLMQRKGLYPPPPGASDLLGLEVAGEIVAVGDGVKRWSVGDKVTALANGGGYALFCRRHGGPRRALPQGVLVRHAGGL